MNTFQLREGTITINSNTLSISNDDKKKKFNTQLITGICAFIYFLCMSFLNFKHFRAKHETFDLFMGILGVFLLLLGAINAYILITRFSRSNEIEISQVKKVKNLNWVYSSGQTIDLYLKDNKIRRLELKGSNGKEFVKCLIERRNTIKSSLN